MPLTGARPSGRSRQFPFVDWQRFHRYGDFVVYGIVQTPAQALAAFIETTDGSPRGRDRPVVGLFEPERDWFDLWELRCRWRNGLDR